MLDASPVDIISVSTINFKDKAFGTDKNMAQLTRQATAKPLMICGRIYDRATADESILDADIVLSGKSLLLNPVWVADIRENKPLKPEQTKNPMWRIQTRRCPEKEMTMKKNMHFE